MQFKTTISGNRFAKLGKIVNFGVTKGSRGLPSAAGARSCRSVWIQTHLSRSKFRSNEYRSRSDWIRLNQTVWSSGHSFEIQALESKLWNPKQIISKSELWFPDLATKVLIRLQSLESFDWEVLIGNSLTFVEQSPTIVGLFYSEGLARDAWDTCIISMAEAVISTLLIMQIIGPTH